MHRKIWLALLTFALVGCQNGGADFEPAGVLTQVQVERFLSLELVGSIPDSSDQQAGGFCAVKFIGDAEYELQNHLTLESVQAATAFVTHQKACGTCSSLQDLVVYAERQDLTTPVRQCALRSWSKILSMNCLTDLGFTEACAASWFQNARNTAKACVGACLKSWLSREPNVNEFGELNACLTCDEIHSGPSFKRSAGRTRRNSGLTSAIPRSADEIYPVSHDY